MPYSVEYQGELARAAELLREAAALTTQPTLKTFLTARADAFLSNDYYASDVAWMELDAAIEPTIGPYEVYEDEWFNAKAAFEAFITRPRRRGDGEAAGVQRDLQELENAPADRSEATATRSSAPSRRSASSTSCSRPATRNRGVQTAAFNLPNDERVVKEKGTKRVMLKNVQEAKFSMVLLPISKVALPAADQANVSFDAFFTHILMHELMHGLGPHNITVGGRQTTVRQELKETYSAIEEAKADVSGLWALQLARRSQAASTPAIAQDDVHDVPGVGVPIDPLRRQRGARPRHRDAAQLPAGRGRRSRSAPDGTFTVDNAKIGDAVTALTREIMTLQAEGNYAKAKGDDRAPRHRPAGSAESARPADRHAGRHRAALHHGGAAVGALSRARLRACLGLADGPATKSLPPRAGKTPPPVSVGSVRLSPVGLG